MTAFLAAFDPLTRAGQLHDTVIILWTIVGWCEVTLGARQRRLRRRDREAVAHARPYREQEVARWL